MKATHHDTVLAEAPESDLIKIEGNWYFPPSSLSSELFTESPTPYTCPWKGEAQYFTVTTGGEPQKDLAWSYPTPYPTAFDRVGKDFSGYVAFDRSVTITD
ncbi:DUF427 domain-containing protein [Mycetocola manganoxydans]|uniref:DUF427 domain-containing protein n=1 Tax=Mycetocola manganoxydans TaxID=699879 RepID=A0A3L6ZVM8_9MICO|nr:DUF427 domain-containing protein [Mycetocola manganoxydans]RLP71919.1 DUF427 domain-containing protein [Mycetocola manganoxydans]GHD47106.1 hypothetical protein GCM10008097_17600 [Mycetocola manganoxydans]